MTELPGINISPAPRPAPSTAARTADTPKDVRQGQEQDSQFNEDLKREMSALEGQEPAAREARDSAAPDVRAKNKDGGEDGQEPVKPVEASLAQILNGAIVVPAMPVELKPLAAAVEAALAGATAAAFTTVAVAAPVAGTVTVPGAPQKAPVQDGPARIRSDAMAVLAEANAQGRETVPGKSGTDTMLAAGAMAAESAAAGKLLPRAATEPATALEALLSQRHAAEAPLQTGGNMSVAAPAQATHSAAPATAAIAAHLAAPGWDRGLGEKMMWMAGQKLQVAELQLNPPDLGPLKISLTISNDQASAQFVSQHAAVREALEAAMPRLREMLAEGGITLGNASVSAESFREQAQAQQDARGRARPGSGEDDSGGTFRAAQVLRASRGLVDIFA